MFRSDLLQTPLIDDLIPTTVLTISFTTMSTRHPYHELPTPLPLKVLVILLSPVWIPLAIARLCLFLFSLICMGIACQLALIGIPKRSLAAATSQQPDVLGTRRTILMAVLKLCVRLMLVSFGCWPGLMRVNGAPIAEASIWTMAPHYGMVDAFVAIYIGCPRPVVLAPYAKIPVIGSIMRAVGALLVPLSSSSKPSSESEGKSATNAVREALIGHKKSFQPGDIAVGLFPEGITHNGSSILTFFPGSFEGGGVIQPVTVVYPYMCARPPCLSWPRLAAAGSARAVGVRLDDGGRESRTAVCRPSPLSPSHLSPSPHPLCAPRLAPPRVVFVVAGRSTLPSSARRYSTTFAS